MKNTKINCKPLINFQIKKSEGYTIVIILVLPTIIWVIHLNNGYSISQVKGCCNLCVYNYYEKGQKARTSVSLQIPALFKLKTYMLFL